MLKRMFFTRVLFQVGIALRGERCGEACNIFLIDRINKANETKIGVDRWKWEIGEKEFLYEC